MAGFIELSMDQGATFSAYVTITDNSNVPVDLTNYTVRSQMRKSYFSETSYDFTITKNDASNGIVSLSMTSSNTSLIRPGRYLYDVEMEADSTVTRVFEGIVIVNPNITRNA